ncbi:HAD hydrolase-like protein [Thioalkalicoccus limnaeus]|uniref:HAD hydrolase-like protein n=1 Tax=Thioalkalicoccus limnaeus TaxID=120681 RepID=UPI0034E95245
MLPHTAAAEQGFEPEDGFGIGHKDCDIEMGRRLGATIFLVLTGYGQHTVSTARTQPAWVVADLDQAANRIGRPIA